MVGTIQQTEAIPANYPTAAPDPIWQRVESYTAHRFTPRNVVWIVEGAGEWTPPLTPATVSTVEGWAEGDGWQTITPTGSPLGGYVFDGFGPYRITASVGAGTAPAAVLEAVERLETYLLDDPGAAKGFTSFEDSVGDVSTRYDGAASWASKALQRSGAADLLRPYRKV